MANRLMLDVSSDARHCPICGDPGDRYSRRGYYLKCRSCKVCFRPQHEFAVELNEYWQEDFWNEQEIKKRKERWPVFRHALEILLSHKPEAKSVLDIGCGIGTFLALCRDDGLSVTGVEPSWIACKVAKREYGLELINEPFSSRIFQGRKFEAIFAAQVLHHLRDPVGFVADVNRVLADDGILIMRTPNLIALEPMLFLQRLLGKEKGFFCGPALYVFHPATLSLLFGRLGYRNVSFVNSRPYLEGGTKLWNSEFSSAANLKRLSSAAVKLTTYGVANAAKGLTNGRAVLGPSIFVVVQKRAKVAPNAPGR